MIPVTKPFLPPIEDYEQYLKGIWSRNWLTNNGPLVNEFELKIKDLLGLNHFLFLGNGTLALQIALKALKIKGEVITTPFSYVATTSSLVWEGCMPVYVDIDPKTLNIDANKVEAAINPNTSAIMATHVFGNPCEIDELNRIAKKHGLKVIYDGAHAFGVTFKGKSIFSYGDISTTSFHATKIFHTVEGGGVFSENQELIKRMGYLRNFGHDGFDKFNGPGINAKNSEYHAAMGLSNLPYYESIISHRRDLTNKYNKFFKNTVSIKDKIQIIPSENYSYYPVIFESEELLLNIKNKLGQHEISCRRYFYPSLNELDYVNGDAPISQNLSRRILCLPLYYDLSFSEQQLICELINDQFKD
ncbi:DegT/DnrJ/EryC1/StrS family aminotransferase [Cyclobacterium sp. 1_MG-2023]|uniref:DegT/DnrJ/EryC1/StrS family aminotransferase n=1 Tax=Cyclobacterium sp. 1_MG-2023 TaxID=3062681 RepID=UPI0026E2BED7|nr:DegT/DnrJ/EryC1/StrS family aminotransferase [Cyclobacterium sp. 1_MG-2023]MDO6439157.1 DegT/DnrJ/EryC1/StrS family aminotransferase [Cyclobacterium sp. 1_MG-2023]